MWEDIRVNDSLKIGWQFDLFEEPFFTIKNHGLKFKGQTRGNSRVAIYLTVHKIYN